MFREDLQPAPTAEAYAARDAAVDAMRTRGHRPGMYWQVNGTHLSNECPTCKMRVCVGDAGELTGGALVTDCAVAEAYALATCYARRHPDGRVAEAVSAFKRVRFEQVPALAKIGDAAGLAQALAQADRLRMIAVAEYAKIAR